MMGLMMDWHIHWTDRLAGIAVYAFVFVNLHPKHTESVEYRVYRTNRAECPAEKSLNKYRKIYNQDEYRHLYPEEPAHKCPYITGLIRKDQRNPCFNYTCGTEFTEPGLTTNPGNETSNDNKDSILHIRKELWQTHFECLQLIEQILE